MKILKCSDQLTVPVLPCSEQQADAASDKLNIVECSGRILPKLQILLLPHVSWIFKLFFQIIIFNFQMSVNAALKGN